MIQQLPLGIGLRESASLASFHSGDNRQAVAAVTDCAKARGEPYLYLWGAPGTGKSHLLQAACRQASELEQTVAYLPLGEHREFSPDLLAGLGIIRLVCLDDVQAIAGDPEWEQGLFNLFNQLRDAGSGLLVSADRNFPQLSVRLPDLRSRLGWGPSFQLLPLDDRHKLAALSSHAERRGMTLPEESARYILHHSARDMDSLLALLERLDRASLAAQRRLTVPFIKSVLG